MAKIIQQSPNKEMIYKKKVLEANYNNIFEKGSKQNKNVIQNPNMDIAIINLNSENGSSL